VQGKVLVDVAKAGGDGPKGREWPGWKLDLPTGDHWGPKLAKAVQAALTGEHLRALAAAYLDTHPDQNGDAPGKRDRNAAAVVWLTGWLADNGVSIDLDDEARGIVTDAYLIGGVSAAAMVVGQPVDLGGWQPGNSQAADDRIRDLGAAAALAALLATSDTGDALEGGYLDAGLLVARGHNLGATGAARDGVDGDFGSLTDAAVRDEQVSAGFTGSDVDSVVDEKTWPVLLDIA
jgi:hypothetical protein